MQCFQEVLPMKSRMLPYCTVEGRTGTAVWGCLNYLSACIRLVVVVLPFVFYGSRVGQSQVVYGSIVGTVTDPTGAIIPGATVTVTDISKGVSQVVTVNDEGNFQVTRLVPDAYTVSV